MRILFLVLFNLLLLAKCQDELEQCRASCYERHHVETVVRGKQGMCFTIKVFFLFLSCYLKYIFTSLKLERYIITSIVKFYVNYFMYTRLNQNNFRFSSIKFLKILTVILYVLLQMHV